MHPGCLLLLSYYCPKFISYPLVLLNTLESLWESPHVTRESTSLLVGLCPVSKRTWEQTQTTAPGQFHYNLKAKLRGASCKSWQLPGGGGSEKEKRPCWVKLAWRSATWWAGRGPWQGGDIEKREDLEKERSPKHLGKASLGKRQKEKRENNSEKWTDLQGCLGGDSGKE